MTTVTAQPQAPPVARKRSDDLSAGHLPALDGVRGLAILLVMATHFTLVQQGILIDRVVGAVGRFGWSGVDLFFVLSGFLITSILLDNKDHPHYFRNFYARRTLRIFPLYYAVIFFATIIVPRINAEWTGLFPVEPRQISLFWLYLSNFAVAFGGDNNDLLGLTWSLAIEEQFYLVWPVLMLLLRRRTLMVICIAAVVVSIGSRTAFVLGGADRLMAYILTPCRMDGIALGCLLGLMLRGGGVQRARELLPATRVVAIVCALLILLFIGYHRTTGFRGGPGQAIGYTVIAVFYACLLLFALASTPTGIANRFFTQRWLIMLGKYSYALYLFHMGIHRIVREYIYGLDDFHTLWGSQLPGQIIFYAICTSLSLAAAWLSWNLLEKHFLKLKVLFPARKSTVSAAAWQNAEVEPGVVTSLRNAV